MNPSTLSTLSTLSTTIQGSLIKQRKFWTNRARLLTHRLHHLALTIPSCPACSSTHLALFIPTTLAPVSTTHRPSKYRSKQYHNPSEPFCLTCGIIIQPERRTNQTRPK